MKNYNLFLIQLIFFTLILADKSPAQAGQLDSTFGQNGIVTTAVNINGDNEINSAKIQNDGKIIVAGYSINGDDYDFALARYNADGSLDNTFGTNGIVTTQIGGLYDVARSIAIQNDGKILAAGQSDYTIALARYNPDGTLDNTFGRRNGIDTLQIGVNASAPYSFANSVVMQSDGKFVAGGQSNGQFALIRCNPNGGLDNTFGIKGKVINSIASNIRSVTIQNDGKIIAAAYATSNFAVARYNNNGTLDQSFNNGYGIKFIGFGGADPNTALLQNDGKIIAAGNNIINGISNSYRAMVRLNSDGSLDSTFGINGVASGQPPVFLSSAILQDDGKIIAAGSSFNNGSGEDFTVVRCTSDGNLDLSFGGGHGYVKTIIGNSNNYNEYANSVVIQTDKKIIIAGASQNDSINSHKVFTLARYIGESSTGINEESKGEIPFSFELYQNYPNPFNPSTKIQYSIPDIGAGLAQTVLKVYDILGNEVATLVNEEKPAGVYEVEFSTGSFGNASNLSSGVYFYKISAGSFNETKKMILLR